MKRSLILAYVLTLTLAGCALEPEAPKRISAAEAEWRQGCRVRHGHVIEEDGELICQRHRQASE